MARTFVEDFRPALANALEQEWIEQAENGEYRALVEFHDLARAELGFYYGGRDTRGPKISFPLWPYTRTL